MKGPEAVFGAPWGKLLMGITGGCIVILVGIPLIGVFSGPRESEWWWFAMVVFPLGLLFGSMFFMIRGYVVTSEAILVRRQGWVSRIPLARLVSAEVDPQAMRGSLRTCGNGGLFCFAGAYWNKRLGSYRAFATDPKRSVVLRFSDRVVVVTPERPVEFVAALKALRGDGGV